MRLTSTLTMILIVSGGAFSLSQGCINDDSTVDKQGDTCTNFYNLHPDLCGTEDTATFNAYVQCCACKEKWIDPWRKDFKCGAKNLLDNGQPAQCNPKGPYPCCSSGGWCGNTTEHCDCATCIDYSPGEWGSCATVNNATCVFPFKFQNQVFVGCTEVGAVDGKPWCSTRTNQEGHHVGGAGGQGNWGHCSSNCPKDLHQSSITLRAPPVKQPCTIRWPNREYRSSANYRKEWIFEEEKVLVSEDGKRPFNAIRRCEDTLRKFGNLATHFTINRAEKGTRIHFSRSPVASGIPEGIGDGYLEKDWVTIEVKKAITEPRHYEFESFRWNKDLSDGWVKVKYRIGKKCLLWPEHGWCGLGTHIAYAVVI